MTQLMEQQSNEKIPVFFIIVNISNVAHFRSSNNSFAKHYFSSKRSDQSILEFLSICI